ncbi:MAG TPA: hypothetical protein VF017_13080 [Thermoanaerobaculia bacterium]|nr:hypothetical protein [Thermoanaerobaculia bacterium]
MEIAVEVFALVNLSIIGLSHVLAPRAWAGFFRLLHQQGEPGVFAVGFMSLWFGSIIVAFHNVWSGLPMILTLIGWGQVLKALIYFTFPAFGLRQIARVPPERAHLFVYGGLILLGLTALLAYDLISR